MDLKDFRKKSSRTLTATLPDGDTFTFEYNAAAYTENFVTRLNAKIAEGGNGLSAGNIIITTLVTGSELREGGKPIKLSDPEVVAELPLQITNAIAEAIQADQSPGND